MLCILNFILEPSGGDRNIELIGSNTIPLEKFITDQFKIARKLIMKWRISAVRSLPLFASYILSHASQVR